MQTFKEYFSDADTAPRDQRPEMDRGNVRVKTAELLKLRDQIKQHRAAAATRETQPLSPEEVEALKHKISSIASELEGSRLPMDAEGAAADAYNDLVAMGEAAEDEGYSHALFETADMLKGFVPTDSLFTEKGEGFKPRKYLDWISKPSPKAVDSGSAYARAYDNEMRMDVKKSLDSDFNTDEGQYGVGRAKYAPHYARRWNSQIPGTPEHKAQQASNDNQKKARAHRIAQADKKRARGEYVDWMEDPRKA